jgi:putative transposase
VKTMQAYRFALAPNNVQAAALSRHAGAARFAYNWGLARVKAALSQREAEKTYGIPEPELTDIPWSLYSLRREWNQAKGDVAPWWAECSKEAFSAGLDALARGLKNWHDSRRGKRKGRRVGFPRFRKRGRARDSFRYTTGAFGPDGDRRVKLPRVGRVKTHEPMGALTSRLADGTARLLGVAVSRTAGRWFVAFTVEVERETPVPPGGDVVGVDLGVSALAVLSTGEKIPNPRHYQRSLRKLRTASRAYARTRPGSTRRRKCAARLARIHARVANQRRDGLHKLTTRLATEFGTVVVEDLNVAGMTRSAKGTAEDPGTNVGAKAGLNRGVLDAAPGELRRQLDYKTTWNGSRLVVADRWFPSSKTCSACGWRNPSLPLRKRTFTCRDCGLVTDRDENAAVNLRQLMTGAGVAGYPGPSGPNARGADHKTHPGGRVAVKREPCAATAGQTGTATWQRVAAGQELTYAS